LSSRRRYLSKLEELKVGEPYIIDEHGVYRFKGILPPGEIPLTNWPSYVFEVFRLHGGKANSPSHGRELVTSEGYMLKRMKERKVRLATDLEFAKELLLADELRSQ
jgi:hypothetical protein